MVCKITSTNRRGRTRGWTLVEMLLASGVGSLVLIAVLSLTFYSSRSFVALSNYADLETTSRLALDAMSREIRQANGLTSFSTTSLVFNDYDNTPLTYTYSPDAKRLTRTKNGSTVTLLKQCETLSFGVYQRNPTNDYNVVATTNAALCKLIQLSWKCSRSILNSNINTESVQSAKIVIRKQ